MIKYVLHRGYACKVSRQLGDKLYIDPPEEYYKAHGIVYGFDRVERISPVSECVFITKEVADIMRSSL
jgi:hypothetical protein